MAGKKKWKGGNKRENKHVSQAPISPLLLPLDMLPHTSSLPTFTLWSLLTRNASHHWECWKHPQQQKKRWPGGHSDRRGRRGQRGKSATFVHPCIFLKICVLRWTHTDRGSSKGIVWGCMRYLSVSVLAAVDAGQCAPCPERQRGEPTKTLSHVML